MLNRIFAALILLLGCYLLSIFFFPKEADEIASLAWINSFNTAIRDLKTRSETVSDTLSNKLHGTWWVLDDAQNVVNQAKNVAETAKNVTERKIEQTKRVVDSVQKAGNAVSELKENLSNLTTLTGAISATGSTGTGTPISQ